MTANEIIFHVLLSVWFTKCWLWIENVLGKAGMKGFKHFIYIFKTSLLFFVCRLWFSSELKNKVNNMKKYAKENYINNIDNIISNNDTGNSSKTFWQIMGRFIGKKQYIHKHSTFTYRRQWIRVLESRKSRCPEQHLYIRFWYRRSHQHTVTKF